MKSTREYLFKRVICKFIYLRHILKYYCAVINIYRYFIVTGNNDYWDLNLFYDEPY